jgi:hypothetical protein
MAIHKIEHKSHLASREAARKHGAKGRMVSHVLLQVAHILLPLAGFPSRSISRESYADPCLFAPNDTTALLADLGINQKVKGIGDGKLTIDLEVCAADRDVMNSAVDFRTLERDRSGLQDWLTLVLSIVHRRDSRSSKLAVRATG